MVHCSCSEFGGVYGIEVLGAPPSEFGGIPAVSQSWKNCLTYFLGLVTLLIYGCIRLAMRGTRQFATAEDELCDILLTMQALQQKRALAAITPIQKKKKVKSRAQQMKEFGKKKSALQLRVEAVLSKYGDKWRRFLMTTSGHPLYQTPEVKELQIMRRSARDEVYEKFYTDSEGRVLPNRQALPWQDNDDMEEKLERWALPVYQRPEVEKTEDGYPLCLANLEDTQAMALEDEDDEWEDEVTDYFAIEDENAGEEGARIQPSATLEDEAALRTRLNNNE